MFKYEKNSVLNKITIGINILFILIIIYNLFYVIKQSPDPFEGIFTNMVIIGTLYLIMFIHLFKYSSSKEKMFIGLADLFPILIFMVLLNLKNVLDLLYSILVYYILALVVIVLVNMGISKVWEKLHNRKS